MESRRSSRLNETNEASPLIALRTPSRGNRQGIPWSSPVLGYTPEAHGVSQAEFDWTPTRQYRPLRGPGMFRKPTERRARRFPATGVVTAEGIPLPSDPDKPRTRLTLDQIYPIAQEGDRDTMRDYPELFITTGKSAFETKVEYAWIYIRPNEVGELPITEERLKVLFPEWQMVLKLSQDEEAESLASTTSTRINLLSPSALEKGASTEAEPFFRTVDPAEAKEATDSDIRKQIWDLRSENWTLKNQIALLEEENKKNAAKINQVEHVLDRAENQIYASGSSRITLSKRNSDVAFGQLSGDDTFHDENSFPDLPPAIERMHLTEEMSNLIADFDEEGWGYGDEAEQRHAKRREVCDQQQDAEGGVVNQRGGWVDKEPRGQVLASLGSQGGAERPRSHGYNYIGSNLFSTSAAWEASDLGGMLNTDNPFGSRGMYGEYQDPETDWMTGLPPYPPLDDQPFVDSQIYTELTSSHQRAKSGSTGWNESFIDPTLIFQAAGTSTPRMGAPSLANEASMEEQEPLPDDLELDDLEPDDLKPDELEPDEPERTEPDERRLVNGQEDTMGLSLKWIRALNDPKLANDPIMKFYQEVNSNPRSSRRKYAGYSFYEDLPTRLQWKSEGTEFDPRTKVLDQADIKLLLHYGPILRGHFELYFRRRDGTVLAEHRGVLDEVDPDTGCFKLPVDLLCSLDSSMLPHYLLRNYPELSIKVTPKRPQSKKQGSLGSKKN